jgi:hypothetical protein
VPTSPRNASCPQAGSRDMTPARASPRAAKRRVYACEQCPFRISASISLVNPLLSRRQKSRLLHTSIDARQTCTRGIMIFGCSDTRRINVYWQSVGPCLYSSDAEIGTLTTMTPGWRLLTGFREILTYGRAPFTGMAEPLTSTFSRKLKPLTSLLPSMPPSSTRHATYRLWRFVRAYVCLLNRTESDELDAEYKRPG